MSDNLVKLTDMDLGKIPFDFDMDDSDDDIEESILSTNVMPMNIDSAENGPGIASSSAQSEVITSDHPSSGAGSLIDQSGDPGVILEFHEDNSFLGQNSFLGSPDQLVTPSSTLTTSAQESIPDVAVFENVETEVSIESTATAGPSKERQLKPQPSTSKPRLKTSPVKTKPIISHDVKPPPPRLVPMGLASASHSAQSSKTQKVVSQPSQQKVKKILPSQSSSTTTTSQVQRIYLAPNTSFLAGSRQSGSVANTVLLPQGKMIFAKPPNQQQQQQGSTLQLGNTQPQFVLISPQKVPIPQVKSSKSPQRPLAPMPRQISTPQNSTGKPLQVIRVVSLPSSAGTTSSLAKQASSTSGQASVTHKIPAYRTIAPGGKPAVSHKLILPATPRTVTQTLTSLSMPIRAAGGSGAPTFLSPGQGQVFVIPANSAAQLVKPSSSQVKVVSLASTPTVNAQRTSFVPIAPSPLTTISASPPQISPVFSSKSIPHSVTLVKSEEPRPKKPCNCTKSACLKLYCDCFANGEFCSNCNCNNCYNNLEHDDKRQKAIRICLERNPHAFHPKIGKGKTATEGIERRHTKGCNCRRSGCLKNYCECYEAKILCSGMCKCSGCKNFEESLERKTLMHLADAADIRSTQQSTVSQSKWLGPDFKPRLPIMPPAPGSAIDQRFLSCSLITTDLVEATAECLLAQAHQAERNGYDDKETEKVILEEFGRCISQIIEGAKKAKGVKIKRNPEEE